MKRILLLFVVLSLAGCADNSKQDPEAFIETETELKNGKGAINGLLIDDAYRPIPAATVYLFPLGLEKTTNDNGEFQFADLDPGPYELRMEAVGFEGIPMPVVVKEREFADAQFEVRRTVGETTRVIVQEFSVFIPCSIRTVENGRVMDCTFDGSGDSYRAFFYVDYTEHEGNVTHMITEMQAHQQGGYRVQIRNTDSGFYRYATAQEMDTTYLRIHNPYNDTNTADNYYGDNKVWLNDRNFQIIVFALGELEEEAGSLGFCCGAGLRAGVRAQFMHTVFVGEPEMDINTYALLGPRE